MLEKLFIGKELEEFMLIDYKKCIQIHGKPYDVVIHIGAHHGEEIKDYVANGVKKVLWFEANKKMMKHLFENTSKFAIKQEYYCEVLSDENDKEIEFKVTNNGQSSSILDLGTHEKHYPHIVVIEKQILKTKRFDTLCEKNNNSINLNDFQFINLDVQGAELKVLKGFGELFDKFNNIKAIYSEVNFEEVYVGAPLMQEIDAYLKNFGFERVITAETPYKWGDALYLRK